MRKFTLMFSAALALAGGGRAVAQATFQVSDDTHTYEYFIQCAGDAQIYDRYITTSLTNAKGLKFANSGDRLKVKIVAGDNSGFYKIVPTNMADYPAETSFIGLSGNATNNDVAIMLFNSETAGTATSKEFQITPTTNYAAQPGVAATSTRYAIATTNNGQATSKGLNANGGHTGSEVKTWNANDKSSTWTFLPANAEALEKFKEANDNNGEPTIGELDFSNVSVSDYATFARDITSGNAASVYLPSGYYRLSNANNGAVGSSTTTGGAYMFSDFLNAQSRNNYKTRGNKPDEATLAHNNYIWHITRTEGTATVDVIGGQGVGIFNGTEYKQDLRSLTLGYSTTPEANDIYFNEGLHMSNQGGNWSLTGEKPTTEEAMLTNPLLLGEWKYNESNGSSWYFEPVSLEGKTVYTVNISGSNDANAYAKLKATGEIALNGGFFILTSGTHAADEFEASETTGHVSQITIDDNAGTINITYEAQQNLINEILTNAINTANEVAGKHGVGYPTADSEAVTTMAAAIATAQTALDGGNATMENVSTLNAAVSTYKSATEGIEMPQDGKAYKIYAIFPNGAELPLYWNGTRIALNNESNITTEHATTFVCHSVSDGKFMFVTNSGKYLLWCDSGDANKSFNVNGYSDAYQTERAYNDWTISRATVGDNAGGQVLSVLTNEDLFGRIMISSVGKNNNQYYMLPRYTTADGAVTDGIFISSNPLAKWYDYNGANESNFSMMRTYTLRMEEVAYPNVASLKTAEGEGFDGIANLGTFSAPFATIVPEGVTAYYVANAQEGAASVAMTQIPEGQAIPANQGVILATANAATTQALMVPASNEEQATIETNALGNSAGAAKTIVSDNAYALALLDGQVAFYKGNSGTTLAMNKAYLQLPSSAAAVLMNFGGSATAINGVDASFDTVKAPVFDITGRKVSDIKRGGIYIQNGRKFIVK